MPKTIFLLEDDESFSIIFRRFLKEADYEVVSAKSAKTAQEMLEHIERPPDLFWIDYYLGEPETGMHFFEWLRKDIRFQNVPAIIVSITVDAEKLNEFERQGVTKTFSKAITGKDAILAAIKKILGE